MNSKVFHDQKLPTIKPSMAEVSSAPPRHTTGPSGSMVVLNADSQAVMERTIVEAFVKLVVCRKFTHQRVVAGSGQVLDSRTTQEEDAPVILNVHQHEMGDVGSSWSSKLRSSPVVASHDIGNASTSAQYTGLDQDDSRLSKSSEQSHRENNTITSHCTLSGLERLSGIAASFPKPETNPRKKPLKTRDGCRKPSKFLCKSSRVRTEMSQLSSRKSKSKTHTLLNIERTKQRDSSNFEMLDCNDVSQSQNAIYFVSDEHEVKSVNGGNGGDDAGCSVTNTSPFEPLDSQQEQNLSTQTTNRQTEALQKPEDLGSGQSRTSKERVTHEDTDSAEMTKNEKELKGLENENENVKRSERETEFINENTDVQEDVEMALNHDTGEYDEGEETCVNNGENIPQPSVSLNMSCLSSPSHACEDSADGQIEETEDNLKKVSTDNKKDMTDTIETSTELADKMNCAEVESSEAVAQCDKPTHSAENDTERDVLVIDISSSVLDQSQQSADSSVSSPASDQPSTSSDRPDPFLHLLSNFPLINKALSVHQQCDPDQSKGNTTARSPVTIKEEPDDDCMITAAFMSARKKSQQGRVVSHTMTSQSASVPHSSGSVSNSSGSVSSSRRLWRGGLAGRVLHQRHSTDHYAQYRLSRHLLPYPGIGFQTQHAMTAETAPSVTYQTSTSSLADSALPSTSTSPPEVPNFLAQHTSLPGQPLDAGDAATAGDVVASSEGPFPMDFSPLTYQCSLCSKIFLHKHKFETHISMCGGHRPFKCKICCKGFNQRAHLDTHMKFHIGIKRYRCDVCPKAYVMKGDLIRHLKSRAHSLMMQMHGMSMPDL